MFECVTGLHTLLLIITAARAIPPHDVVYGSITLTALRSIPM